LFDPFEFVSVEGIEGFEFDSPKGESAPAKTEETPKQKGESVPAKTEETSKQKRVRLMTEKRKEYMKVAHEKFAERRKATLTQISERLTEHQRELEMINLQLAEILEKLSSKTCFHFNRSWIPAYFWLKTEE